MASQAEAGPSRIRVQRLEPTALNDFSLAARLTLEDIQELQTRSLRKGKRRAGSLTDADLALSLAAQEVQASMIFDRDRALAMSLSEGELKHGALPFYKADPVIPLDRNNGSNTTHTYVFEKSVNENCPSVFPTQQKHQQPWPDPPEPVKQTRKCIVCYDPIKGAKIRAGCGHYYDPECALDLFKASLRDESLFPPGCCGQPIPISRIQKHMDSSLLATFLAKVNEFGTLRRVYCANPRCSLFLGPQSDDIVIEPCSCGTTTCRKCRIKVTETSHMCIVDGAEVDQTLVALGKEKGWVRCPGCGRMVELQFGCFHMVCFCKTNFCYLCGRAWKTCRCPLWHEERLLAGDPAEDRQVVHAVPLPSRKSRGRRNGQASKPVEVVPSPSRLVLRANVPSAVHDPFHISSSETPQPMASSSKKVTKPSRLTDPRSSNEISPSPDPGTNQGSSSGPITPTTHVVSRQQAAVTFPALGSFKPMLDARGWHPDPALAPTVPEITKPQGFPPYLFGAAPFPFHSISAPPLQDTPFAQPSSAVPMTPGPSGPSVSSFTPRRRFPWFRREGSEKIDFGDVFPGFVFPSSPAQNWPEEFRHPTIVPFSMSTKQAKTPKMNVISSGTASLSNQPPYPTDPRRTDAWIQAPPEPTMPTPNVIYPVLHENQIDRRVAPYHLSTPEYVNPATSNAPVPKSFGYPPKQAAQLEHAATRHQSSQVDTLAQELDLTLRTLLTNQTALMNTDFELYN